MTTSAKETKIKFVCKAIKWFDKVNGNTYHSVQVIRCSDGQIAYGEFEYDYGEQYRQTALTAMKKAGWLPKKYSGDNDYLFERENNYPVEWVVSEGTKRECVNNGQAK